MLREEHKLRVLRKIFRPTKEEITGEGRRSRIGIHGMSALPNIVWALKSNKMVVCAGHMGSYVRADMWWGP